ncbi:BPL-N domain-containing protein [candidate division KSB1 bacterium]|nr:BPL-N domain-containing protein [candidate division KSB1 bacterium]
MLRLMSGSRHTWSSCIWLLLCSFYGQKSGTEPEVTADLAIYAGRGTWEESVQAAQKMFEWMEWRVTLIYARDLNQKELHAFRLLVVSGGDMYQYAQDLTATAKAKIRNFIHGGGGYIGICSGAYFACSRIWWRGNQSHK